MQRRARKRKLPLVDGAARGERDLLGSYKPPSSNIEDFAALYAAPMPSWSEEPVKRLDFQAYLQRAELLLNGLLLKLIAAPRPALVSEFAVQSEFFLTLHNHLQSILLRHYPAFRQPESRGNLIYSSKALIVSVIAAKAAYVHRLLLALNDAVRARQGRNHQKPLAFEAPFLPCDAEPMSAGTPRHNGEACVPETLCATPKELSPELYEQRRLLYPNKPIGSFSQSQLERQLRALADGWDKLDLLKPGVTQVVRSLHERFMELQVLSFGAGSAELDGAATEYRPEPHRGYHPESPAVQKMLQFARAGLEVEENAITKEIRKLKKRQALCHSLSHEYQIRVLGILVPMLEELRFLGEQLVPRLRVADARRTLCNYVIASFIRFSGGIPMLFPDDDGDAVKLPHALREMCVIQPHGSEIGNQLGFAADPLEDYKAVYDSMQALLLEKQSVPIDDTTKLRLCNDMRLMQVPFGAAETNCLRNQLRWTQERKDLEDVCVPRMTQTHQLVHWETRPTAYFLRARWPLTMRLVIARYMIDAITSSQAVQRRVCSHDALVISHVLDIGELAKQCKKRALPFVLQLGSSLFLHLDGWFYPCNNIVEGLMVWFMAVYSQTGGVFREGSLREVRLGYLEFMVNTLFYRVPEAVILRYRRLVHHQLALRAALPGGTEEEEDMLCETQSDTDDAQEGGGGNTIYELIEQLMK